MKRWIIARWLLRDLTLLLLAVLLVLLLTSLGGRVVGFLSQAAAGELTPAMLAAIVIYRIPLYLQLVLPLALFLVVMLTLGRGFAERELLIAEGAGWAPFRVARLLLVFAALPVLGACVLTFWATPHALRQLTHDLDEQARAAADRLVQPGRFIELGDADRIAYVGAVDRVHHELRDIFIADGVALGGSITVIRADHGRQVREANGEHYLLLRSGVRWTGRAGSSAFQILQFDSLHWRLPGPQISAPTVLESMPTEQLIAAWRRGGGWSRANPIGAELFWRTSLPVCALLSVLLAAALGRVRLRQGRFDRLWVASLVFLGYFGSLVAVRTLLANGWPGSLLLAPLPHAFVLVLALWRLGSAQWRPA